jgi:hypothetical protein
MLSIKPTDTVKTTVHLRFPEDGSVLSGSLDCHFKYFPQSELDKISQDQLDGKISTTDVFKLYVRGIDGLPDPDGKPVQGDAVYDWLDSHPFGNVIRSAVLQEYAAAVTEARAKNSRRSLGR